MGVLGVLIVQEAILRESLKETCIAQMSGSAKERTILK